MNPEIQQNAAARAYQLIRRFGAPHRRLFVRGMIATVFVVAARLAMPWPLRGILEIVSQVRPYGGPDWLQAAFVLAAAYVAIATVLGFLEMIHRVSFKAFAAKTVHGMRECAVTEVQKAAAGRPMPELLSRIIGDTARIKAEMSGILVHVTQNGLLFAGVVVIFLFLAPMLSFFFLLGGVFAISSGYLATKRISAVTKAQREKESEYALFVNDLLENGSSGTGRADANNASARQDVNATKLIARSAWINHVGLAIITGIALLVAIREAQHGRVTLGEVFLFIAYALTVHRRMVQVGRQLARGGKLVANVTRIQELIDPEDNDPACTAMLLPEPSAWPATQREQAADIPTGEVTRRGAAIALLHLDAEAGSALFRTMPASPAEHASLWQTLHLPEHGPTDSPDVAFVAANPDLKNRRIRYFVPDRALLKTKEGERLGLADLVKRLPGGLKTRSSDVILTRREAQALALARLLWSDTGPGAWLIEDPVSGLSASDATRLLKLIIRRAKGRTLVITLASADGIDLSRFDRLVVFDGEHITFDGRPSVWLQPSPAACGIGEGY